MMREVCVALLHRATRTSVSFAAQSVVGPDESRPSRPREIALPHSRGSVCGPAGGFDCRSFASGAITVHPVPARFQDGAIGVPAGSNMKCRKWRSDAPDQNEGGVTAASAETTFPERLHTKCGVEASYVIVSPTASTNSWPPTFTTSVPFRI
jgi:hypothetical protein